MFPDERKCELISVENCKHMFYNETQLPNTLSHKTQEEVQTRLRLFTPLIEAGCSPVLESFLCLLYLPKCSLDGNITRPCQSLCEAAKKSCKQKMQEIGFLWPEEISCDDLPQSGSCLNQDLPGNLISYIFTTFYPTDIKGCRGIVFTHGVRAFRQRKKVCPGCISETVRCGKFILGRDIGYGV